MKTGEKFQNYLMAGNQLTFFEKKKRLGIKTNTVSGDSTGCIMNKNKFSLEFSKPFCGSLCRHSPFENLFFAVDSINAYTTCIQDLCIDAVVRLPRNLIFRREIKGAAEKQIAIFDRMFWRLRSRQSSTNLPWFSYWPWITFFLARIPIQLENLSVAFSFYVRTTHQHYSSSFSWTKEEKNPRKSNQTGYAKSWFIAMLIHVKWEKREEDFLFRHGKSRSCPSLSCRAEKI